MAKSSKSVVSTTSRVTKRGLQANIMTEIKRYESTAKCTVKKIEFPTDGIRRLKIDTVPLPE